MVRSLLALFAILAASFLGSCGGNSSSPPPPPPSPALEKVASVATGRGTAVDPAGNVYAMSVRFTVPTSPAVRVLAKIAPLGGSLSFTDVSEGITEVVASDAAGNIYVGGSMLCHGSSGCFVPPAPVQKVAPDGTVTPLLVKGSSDGTLTTVFTEGGLAVDKQGNVYISHDDSRAIEKLTPAGDLTTVAGASVSTGQEVDGNGTMARFAGPAGLAFDSAGNLYIADSLGNTIRKMTPDGTVTTVAGKPFVAGTTDGPRDTATFNFPTALAVDASGVIYVADTDNTVAGGGNARMRRIDLSGDVTTVAGTRGMTGFTPGPAPGVIDPPSGLALFGNDLYFTMDTAVGVVRNVR